MAQDQKVLKTGYQVIAEQTLSESEAAHVLGIEDQTLAGIRRRNGISYRQVTKVKVVYHVDDIKEYLSHVIRKAKFVHSD